MRSQVIGGPAERSTQVGTADIADEERVAGEDGVGLSGIFVEIVFRQIENQNRNRLDGVAGRFEHLQAKAGEFERVAVFHGDEFVFRLGARAQMNGRTAAVAQFEVPGDEVGVKVTEKDMTDVQSEFVRVVEVLLNVALWVNYDAGRTGFVSEQVRGVGQATKIILFQEHGRGQYTWCKI